MFPSNLLLSSMAGGYAFFIANLEPILTFGLPVALFLIGKGIDVAVKLYLSKKDNV
jgi:hypothetical protein